MSCRRGCCIDQATHYRSVTILGPSAKRDAVKREERDLDAYARLVRSGVQPKGIDGAAELERGAETTHEVENRNIITDRRLRQKVTDAFAAASTPVLTPLPDDAA